MSKKYNEPDSLTDVAKFHDTFGAPILDIPTIPAQDRCDLRVSLIQEELNELKEAIVDNDMVEVADALADIQYVLSGAILEFGLADRFKEIFDEVQRSNMSKTCKSMNESEKTRGHYKATKGVDSTIVEKNGEYLVYRIPDNKVLKSVAYSPADLKSIVER